MSSGLPLLGPNRWATGTGHGYFSALSDIERPIYKKVVRGIQHLIRDLDPRSFHLFTSGLVISSTLPPQQQLLLLNCRYRIIKKLYSYYDTSTTIKNLINYRFPSKYQDDSSLERLTVDVGLDQWSDFVHFTQDNFSKQDCEDEEYQFIPDFQVPLTNEEKSLFRYRHTYTTNRYPLYGERWGISFSFYEDMLPAELRHKVFSFLRQYHLLSFKNSKLLYSALKKLTSAVKYMHKPSFWPYLVNLETFGGYVNGVFTDSTFDEVFDWTNIIREHTVNGSVLIFLLKFYHYARDVCKDLIMRPEDNTYLTPQQFIDDPLNYFVNGSTMERVSVRDESGQKVRKTKTAAYSGMSKRNLMKLMYNTKPMKARIILKRETGKLRPVINSEDSLYLQMTYAHTFIEPRVRGSPLSTLFMSNSQYATTQISWVRSIVHNRVYNVPLDQSNFDHQSNTDMILLAIHAFALFSENTHYRNMLHLILKRIQLGTSIALPNSSSLFGFKGVLSGWKWTAFLDTVINLAELRTISSCFPSLFLPQVCAQGDDDLIATANLHDALLLVAGYKAVNISVNMKKFFISKQYNEFLRILYDKNGCRGYPARSINALLSRSPITKDPVSGILRARQQLTNWMIAHNRGLNVTDFMRDDICNANQLSADRFEAWLHSPASVGGAGMFPWAATWVSISPGTILKHAHTGIAFSENPQEQEFLSKMISDYTNTLDTPGEIRDVPRLRSLRCDRPGRLPISPKFRDELYSNMFQLQLLKERQVSNKDYASMIDSIHPEQRQTAHTIRQKCGNAVFMDWYTGKLDYHCPVVPNVAERIVSAFAQRFYEQAFFNVVTYNNNKLVNKTLIKRSALWAEMAIYNYIMRIPYHLAQ